MKINKNIAISDSGFVFNPTNGESFSVNPIGAEIIDLIKSDRNFEDILQFLSQKYRVEEKTIEKDYLDFMGMLKQYNLIDFNEEA